MSSQIPKIGVLQLKTTFPRPPGDVGHVATWGDIPAVIRVVEEADSVSVVQGTWGPELVDAFVREGEKMIKEDNCVAFVTSCGFLATMHPLLASRLPFIGTSSLIQVAWLQNQFFPGPDSKDSVGVITFKKSALTPKHFVSVGAHPETPYVGLPEDKDTAVFRGVLDERIPYDYEGMEAEMRAACRELLRIAPKIKAIVLECTNMPPFTHAVADETGLKVWDIISLGRWLYQGATPVDHRK